MMKPIEDRYKEIQSDMENEDHEATINRFKALLAESPDFAPAHADLGSLYYQSARQEEALKHFKKAAQLDPDNAGFQKNLADFYYTVLSRPEDALEIYERLLVSDRGNSDILAVAANLLVSLNRFDEALVYYEKLIHSEPWRLDVQEMIDKIKARGKENPDQGIEQQYQNVQAEVQDGNLQGAIQSLKEMLKGNPDYAVAHNDLGVLYCQTGEVEKALQHYEKAVTLAPTNTIFLKNLAEYYLYAMGEIEKALELYVVVLKDQPQDTDALMAAGHISEKFKNIENARLFYEAILDVEPWNLEASERLSAIGQEENVSKSKLFSL